MKRFPIGFGVIIRRAVFLGFLLLPCFAPSGICLARQSLRSTAEALLQAGDDEAAIGTLLLGVAAEPSDPYWYRKLAEIHAQRGELDRAATTLEEGGSRCAPEAQTLYQAAAVLRERMGEPGQALLDYRAMLRSAPRESAPALEKDLSQHLAYLGFSVDRSANTAGADASSGIGTAGFPGTNAAGLPVPGGFQTFARTVGVDVSVLRAPDAMERIFSYILENAASGGSKIQDNPALRDPLSYLRTYDKLMRHLNKLAAPALPGPGGSSEYVFRIPVLSAKPGKADFNTVKLLSFFGITLRADRGKSGQSQLILVQNTSGAFAERQLLLRSLGINVLDPSLSEIRFWVRREELPLILGADAWNTAILTGKVLNTSSLLERFLSNPKAMKLYIALAACSDQARQGLLRAVPGADLLKFSEPLVALGKQLEFRNGTLFLPGAQSSWDVLPAASSAGDRLAALLRAPDARGLGLYSALSAASRSVQSILTSATTLPQLYSSPYLQRWGVRNSDDLARVFSRLRADERGLFLPIDRRFAPLLISQDDSGTDSGGAGEFEPLRLEPAALPGLLDHATARPHTPFTLPDTLELLSYLQAERPEALGKESIAALSGSIFETPLFLDLIWDLNPPSDLLAGYIEFCRKLSSGRVESWDENRARTSESLFYLLSALRHEEAITHEDGVKLLAKLLEALNHTEEGRFAQAAARFLSQSLMPLLTRPVEPSTDSPDPMLRALSGPGRPTRFRFEGKRLELDSSANELSRMKGSIQQQRFTPLSSLLEICGMLDELESRGKPGTDDVKRLVEKLAAIRSPELEKPSAKETLQHVARSDIRALTRALDERMRIAGPSQLAAELSAGLHPELGVTLLAYCYAHAGSQGIDPLSFDANFVRRHRFFLKDRRSAAGWEPAHIERQQNAGTFVAGSLSGLSSALCRLETMQSARVYAAQKGTGLLPTLLSDVRTMRRSLLSDRAQEYVALTARLGRELLALTGMDKSAEAWADDVLSRLVAPKRKEQLFKAATQHNLDTVAQILSPSEQFLLGEAYLKTSGDAGTPLGAEPPPQMTSPVLQQLRAIESTSGQPDAALFRKEVEQYGVVLRRRLGIGDRSLAFIESYERLDGAAREDLLYERMCDLKIRLAELNYSLGLPALLTKEEGELALRGLLPPSPEIRTDGWRLALERIGLITAGDIRSWLDELVERGFLVINEKP
jgi:tetratricopeptide (TPR) repeat protein